MLHFSRNYTKITYTLRNVETHKNGWSRSMVSNQMAMKAYERSLINPTTTEATP